jgi:hypothetical protein
MNSIMNKELNDLKERRIRGHKIAAPSQGIHPVGSVMAQALNLQLDNPENWNFIQLYNPKDEHQCYNFIFQHKSTLDYVESWRRSLIDYTKYKIEIEVSFFQVSSPSDQSRGTILECLDVSNVAKTIENKTSCEATIKKEDRSQILISYSTKCKIPSEQEQLAEIDAFKLRIEEYLQVISIHTGLGYSYINLNVIKPETFWHSGRGFSITQLNVDKLEALDIILSQRDNLRRYAEILVTLNSLASFRAQIVYGFECIKTCLNERVEARQKDLFNLSTSQKRNLNKVIRNSVKCWLTENNGGINVQQILHIDNTSSRLYIAATHKYWELLLIELQELELGIDNLVDEFNKLKKLRNSLSHINNDNYDRETYENGMKIIRRVFTRLIERSK